MGEERQVLLASPPTPIPRLSRSSIVIYILGHIDKSNFFLTCHGCRYFEPSGLVPRFFHAEDNFVIEEFIEGDLWTEQIRSGAGASPELLNSV